MLTNKWLGIFLAAWCVSGCTMLGVAAGAGGTYYATTEYQKSKQKQERAIERRVERETVAATKQQQRQIQNSDQVLASALSQRMLNGSLTKVLAIHPVIQNGTVVLYGNVPSKDVADRAVAISQNFPGVRNVISNLTIVEMEISPTGHTSQHEVSMVPVAIPVPQRNAIPPQLPPSAGAVTSPPRPSIVPQTPPPGYAAAPQQRYAPPTGNRQAPPPGYYAPPPEQSLQQLITQGNPPQQAAAPLGYARQPYGAPPSAPPQGYPPPSYGQQPMLIPPSIVEPDNGTIKRTLPDFDE